MTKRAGYIGDVHRRIQDAVIGSTSDIVSWQSTCPPVAEYVAVQVVADYEALNEHCVIIRGEGTSPIHSPETATIDETALWVANTVRMLLESQYELRGQYAGAF